MIKKVLTHREIIYTALFGALWGILELTVGTSLHLMKIPMRGMLMAILASGILIVTKRFIRYQGSLILVGFITAAFKALSIGFIFTPIIAILLEALIAEIVIFIFGYNRLAVVMSSIVILFYTIIHSLATHAFFFGFKIYNVYQSMLEKISNTLFGTNDYVVLLMGITIVLIIIIGTSVGIISYHIANRTEQKLKMKLGTNYES